MASAPINFPPLRYETPLTVEDKISPDAHRVLLQLSNGHPLISVSTAKGNQNIPVPLAKLNQNVEITYIKTSADANTFTLQASGTDMVNFGTPAVSGNQQGAKIRIKSDGKSNWYVVG